MQSRNNKVQFADEIKKKKYIDNYIDKWLKLETVDRSYVECDICGYVSNASIHQHLLVPEKFDSDPNNNRIIHLCANCDYELRAMIERTNFKLAPEMIVQICEEAFEKLKEKKKRYREMHLSMERIEV
ncbi:Uncharacterised protein [uncultured archaeon]|nr:Uncharacterised protein [uncultured archaeon]